MIKILSIAFILSISFFLSACSDDETSDEVQIRDLIQTGKLAAENRKHDEFFALIDSGYQDSKGRNQKALAGLAQTYFFMHKNIHLFVKIDDIVLQDDKTASVTLYAAMAGTVISDLNMLSSLRAQIYKFELQLIKDEVWLINQAKWQRSSLKDMIKITPPTQ